MTLDARVVQIPAIRRSALLLCCLAAAIAAGCATDKLATVAPAGVDLSGQWTFDTNLSDDPSQLQDDEQSPAKAAAQNTGSTVPTGFGKPGTNGPDSPLAAGSTDPLFQGDSQDPDDPDDPDLIKTIDASAIVAAPQTLTITQRGSEVNIASATANGKKVRRDYMAGTIQTMPWPHGGAKCESGWRGPAFVITTRPKRGKVREDDYALDDAGHLILTIQTRKLDIKLVYDRVRT